jgi:putative transposase
MKFQAIDHQREEYAIRWMCRILEVSPAGFYAWKTRPISKRQKSDSILTVAVKAAHKASRGTYGSPRLRIELRDQGQSVGRNRLMRIMRQNALSGRRKRKYVHTTNSNHAYPVADNLLARDFSATVVNQKWVGDITYISTQEGWLYLAVLVDLFSRKIIGWATSESMHTNLPLEALRMALLHRRPPPGVIHHTDRGSQYASNEYRRILEQNGIVCSMSRRSDCWDNAPGESIFSRIKDDLIYRNAWESRAQATAAI